MHLGHPPKHAADPTAAPLKVNKTVPSWHLMGLYEPEGHARSPLGEVMATFKADRDYGSVDGDVNAKAIFSDRRQHPALAWAMIVQALVPIGSAIAYGLTGSPGWLAFLILNAAWLVISVVDQRHHQQMTWLMVIERRCQLFEQDADDLAGEVRQALPPSRY